MFAQSKLRAIQVFFITFFAYSSVHALRTTYSSNKNAIGQNLETTKLYLGFLDSAMLISLGIGHFMHVISAQKMPVYNLKIALTLIALSFITIGQVAIHLKQTISEILVLILIIFNGFLQSYTWPNLLMVVGGYFSSQSQSTQLGFWASCVNFGNIFGYLISGFILKSGWHWQHAFTICSAFMLTNTLLIWLRIEELGTADQAQKNNQQQKQQSQDIIQKKSKSFLQNIKAIFYSPKVLLYCIIFALSKSVIYGLLLWLPIYFQDKQLNTYAQIVPIFYDLFSILGSVVLGKIFPMVSVKGKIFAPTTLILILSFTLLKLVELNIVGYLILISLIGMLLGGIFNIIGSVVTISLTEIIPKQNQNQYIGIYSALVMAFGNFTTALTQILIGIVVDKNQSSIFTIFAFYQLLVVVFSFILIHIETKQRQEKNQELRA